MITEVKPRIKSGFFVNEVELTRIKDAQNEQIKNISEGSDANFIFEVKYKNGVIHHPSSLTEIISDENDGSRKIVQLAITAESEKEKTNHISVKFVDVSERSYAGDSLISYDVVSNDKDWTFVTASIMEERLNKIKISKLMNWFITNKIYGLIVPFLPMFVMLYIFSRVANSSRRVDQIKEIRSNATSMYDYMYKVDLATNQINASMDSMPSMLIGIFFASIMLGWLLKIAANWFQTYTLYWGDGTKIYDRKMSLIKFFIGGIVFAILIGMVGNFFYDKLLAT